MTPTPQFEAHSKFTLTDPIDFMTVKEFAAKYRVHPLTVYKLAKSGELKHFRVGGNVRLLPIKEENE